MNKSKPAHLQLANLSRVSLISPPHRHSSALADTSSVSHSHHDLVQDQRSVPTTNDFHTYPARVQ